MNSIKLLFPVDTPITNPFNDNVDINVVLDNNKVYAGTAFTLANIETLMANDNYDYFWSSDMLIVDNLKYVTLINAINKINRDGNLDLIFKYIGTIQEIYGDKNFENIEGIP